MTRLLLLLAVLLTSQALAGTATAQKTGGAAAAPSAEQADTDSPKPAKPKKAAKPRAAKPKAAKPKAARPEVTADEESSPAPGMSGPPPAPVAQEEDDASAAKRFRSLARGESDTSPASETQGRRQLFGVLLLTVALLLLLAQWLRHWLSSPRLRRLIGAAVAVLRISLFVCAIGLALLLIPTGSQWFWWATIATFVFVAWSIRDLFADLIAGIIITAERRIKKGMWISGEHFEGTVERRSLRATWLRDGEGHQITVPNRAMVSGPLVYDSGAEAEHEVIVRLEGYGDASSVRQALNDAVLSSPWVLAGAAPVVLRDPADPVLWRVRSRLLEPRFAVRFSGELLERVEDILQYESPVPAPTEPGAGELSELTDDANDS